MAVVIGLAVGMHAVFAFFTDLATRKIPNGWNAAVAIGGVAVHGVMGGWRGAAMSISGLVVLFLLTAALQLAGAIGGGDVKWFAALGSWTGALFALRTLLYTILVAGLFALVYLLLRGTVKPVLLRWFTAGWLAAAGKSLSWFKLAGSRADAKEMPLMIAVLPAVLLASWLEKGGGVYWLIGF